MKKLLFVSALLSSSVVVAAGKAKSTTPYGMAGCGLGALLIDKNEMLPQVGAWFLNSIYGNQTFGITSGTSNCVESRTETAAMEQEVFVAANLSSLSKEAAQGKGQLIDGLAEVFGCYGEAERVRLGEISQQYHGQIFAALEPASVVQNYLSNIQQDTLLGKACHKAS